MKRLPVVIGLLAAAATLASGSAMAWRGGVRVWVGPGFYPYPYAYPVAPYPYYGPAPVVVVPGQSEAYVEQSQQAAAGDQGGDTWYYCDKSKAYYPYVKTCPAGWRTVPAQPVPQQ
ncbi:hypothetical protein PTE30175_02869 [Pandoraea terrae]|uniref:Lipoprotein n=1 Tax=Pandoraea terrae TaxID=1537710 RepID=A0A5E4VXM1_9BURK|nr:hypothetical protein [Pandoraea terrae]VVE17387.1 hypothetical protein PTE30175_02869 [Pandoraea terrae]